MSLVPPTPYLDDQRSKVRADLLVEGLLEEEEELCLSQVGSFWIQFLTALDELLFFTIGDFRGRKSQHQSLRHHRWENP